MRVPREIKRPNVFGFVSFRFAANLARRNAQIIDIAAGDKQADERPYRRPPREDRSVTGQGNQPRKELLRTQFHAG